MRLSERAAAEKAGMARNTWAALERGSRRTQPHRNADIELTLNWGSGSVEAILDGGEPREVLSGDPLVERYVREARGPRFSSPASDGQQELVDEIERIKSLPMPVEARLTMLRALIDLYAEQAAERGATGARNALVHGLEHTGDISARNVQMYGGSGVAWVVGDVGSGKTETVVERAEDEDVAPDVPEPTRRRRSA